MQRRRRHLAALVAAGAIAVGSSGCSGAGSSTATPAGPDPHAGAPPPGSCSADVGADAQRRPGSPPPPAPCDQRHGTETWLIADLPPPWSGAQRARPEPGSPAEAELATLAADRCPADVLQRYTNFLFSDPTPLGDRQAPTPLRTLWFYPSADDWARGGRWVRCDVGFSWNGETREAVKWKAPLRPAILQQPEARQLLSRDCATSADPTAPTLDYTSCQLTHAAEVVSSYRAEPGAGPPAADDATWKEACTADAMAHLGLRSPAEGTGRLRFAITPYASTTEWATGDHTVRCLLSYQDRASGSVAHVAGSAANRTTGEPPAAD